MINLTSKEQSRFLRYMDVNYPYNSMYNGRAWAVAQLYLAVRYHGEFDQKILLAKVLRLYPEESKQYVPITAADDIDSFRYLWEASAHFHSVTKRKPLHELSQEHLALLYLGSVSTGGSFGQAMPAAYFRSLYNTIYAMQAQEGRKVHCLTCNIMKPMNAICAICGFEPKSRSEKKESAFSSKIKDISSSFTYTASSTTGSSSSWRDPAEELLHRLNENRGE